MMNAETIRRVTLAALRDYEYKLDAHYDGHPNAIEERDIARAAIAAIEAGGAWEPDENGLLPCPFCGGKAEMWEDGDNSPNWHVSCVSWYCCVVDGQYQAKAEAIAAWNRRTTAPQPAAWEPDWSKAPEWAQWYSIDKDGKERWWEVEPVLNKIYTWWLYNWELSPYHKSRHTSASKRPEDYGVDWRTTLRKRPDSEATP